MLRSINPATGRLLHEFPEYSDERVTGIIDSAHSAFQAWQHTTFATRALGIVSLAELLRQRKDTLATLITTEMGKPITQAHAEVEKCAWCCEYFAQEAEQMLAPLPLVSDATTSGVVFEPLGVILGIMPWNFPLWQVFRAAIPALMAGNTVVIKHASNVPQTTIALQQLIGDSKLDKDVFQFAMVNANKVEPIIKNAKVNAITLTGSTTAGKAVATAAANEVKKVVLELGGSDPFIILADASLELIVPQLITARLQNNGQSCIAAKRFIVHESKYKDVIELLTKQLSQVTTSDPLLPTTVLGPLVSAEARESLHKQITDSQTQGAQVLLGGTIPASAGFYYPPTIITGVTSTMSVWAEETFGPVFPIVSYTTEEELISLANHPRYGLGASIWTDNPTQAEHLVPMINAGSVFINGIVKSDPRLPFGGIQESGYGRELSTFGIREFVNIKTVWRS